MDQSDDNVVFDDVVKIQVDVLNQRRQVALHLSKATHTGLIRPTDQKTCFPNALRDHRLPSHEIAPAIESNNGSPNNRLSP